MKIGRDRLAEIAERQKATKDEIAAMARELLALRDAEAKRHEVGGVPVHLEHVGPSTVSGWFAPRRGHITRSQLHVGARVSLAGRVYGIVSIDGDLVRVR